MSIMRADTSARESGHALIARCLRLTLWVAGAILLWHLAAAHLRHDLFWWPTASERAQVGWKSENGEAPLNNIPTGSKDAVLLMRRHGLSSFYMPLQCESIIFQRIVEAALPIRYDPRSRHWLILNHCVPVPADCRVIEQTGKLQLAICR